MIASAESCVAIGFYLKQIWETEQYRESGYASIWECAKAEFGFTQDRASRYIDICRKFSVDGDSPYLMDKYKQFNKSQLIEMLSIKDENLAGQVTPDMSVGKIRKLKNENAAPVAVEAAEDKLPGQMKFDIEGEYRELDIQEATEGDCNDCNDDDKEIAPAAVETETASPGYMPGYTYEEVNDIYNKQMEIIHNVERVKKFGDVTESDEKQLKKATIIKDGLSYLLESFRKGDLVNN
jgi:hypothetical protein